MLILIFIANTILPIMATVQGVQDIVKSTFSKKTLEVNEAYKNIVKKDLEDLYRNKVTYELVSNWTDYQRDIVNVDYKAVVYTENFLCNVQIKDPYLPEHRKYASERRCGLEHCEEFKNEMREKKLCAELNKVKLHIDLPATNIVVDEDIVRCLSVAPEKKKFFMKSPKVCLCTYIVALHQDIVSYMMYENVDKRGVYHYTRLDDRPYHIIPEEKARYFKDSNMKVTWTNLFIFDSQILKKYKELYYMQNTKESTCESGVFKVVLKENYKKNPGSDNSVHPYHSGPVLERETSSSSSVYSSTQAFPVRPPPHPLTFVASSSSSHPA